jgi:outer membrane biosynthesis protein TonB
MPDPRLSAPPKGKNTTVVIVIVLALLALGAGLLTWALYPDDPPPRPAAQHRQPTPQPKLVELPVEQPPAPPTPAAVDADVDASDGDVDRAVKRTKRARMPEGTIDTRRLTAFIRSKQGQVQQCYERRLKMNHMLQGVLVPQIRIHPSGSVMSVTFSQDTLNDSSVKQCVARVINSWQFPQPDGGAVTVSNPFRFTPRVD